MRPMKDVMRNVQLRQIPVRAAVTLAATALLLGVTAAHAGPTPEQQCQAGKNKTAGKYAACRESAEAKLAASGDTTKYGGAITKCADKFATAWQKLEDKAAQAGTTCLDGIATESPFQAVIDDQTDKLAVALSGGGLQVCGNGTVEEPESCDGGDLGAVTCVSLGFTSGTLACTAGCGFDVSGCVGNPPNMCGNGTIEIPEQCDGANLDSQTCADRPGFTFGALRCGSGCTFDTSGCFATRYVDNGNGTVTDHETGLQWEKKTTAVGSGVNLADPHDVDNNYTWNTTFGGTSPNGTAFTDFLNKLNGGATGVGNCTSSDGSTQAGGFAGRCDWRLPTIAELQTIVDTSQGYCGTGRGGACIDPIFGPTAEDWYWSSTTSASIALQGWETFFFNGMAVTAAKSFDDRVRAVRGGP